VAASEGSEVKNYLDPSSYDASTGFFLFYALGRYRRELRYSLVVVGLTVLDYILDASWQEAVTTACLLLFIYFPGLGPTEVSKAAKEYDSKGEPLPKAFSELQDWFSSAFAPMGIAATVTLALVIYGWSSPPQPMFSQFPSTKIFSFFTNVCIMGSVAAWSWSYALKKINKGEYNKLWGGLVVLLPLGVIAFATAEISITSGLAQWEDSVCTFLPGTILSLYATVSTASPGYISPAAFRQHQTALESKKADLQRKLQWMETQKGSGGEDYEKRQSAAKAELSTIGSEIERRQQVLSIYRVRVSKTIERIAAYESRRREREGIAEKGPDSGIASDAKSKIDEAVKTLARVPSKEPKSYVNTRQFALFRQSTTVMNFPIILQANGFYLPTVTNPEFLKLAQELDRTTYEDWALTSFEYFLRTREAAEIVWLWSATQSKASARHCITYLRDTLSVNTEYLRLIIDRQERIKALTEKDPESRYSDLIPSTTGPGPGLAVSKRIAEMKLGVISRAYSLVEPFLKEMGGA